MNRQTRFPRAIPGEHFVVMGDVWNALVEAVEWSLRIQVSNPLGFQDINGPFISIKQGLGWFWARITASAPLQDTNGGNPATGTTPTTGRWKYGWKEIQRHELNWQDVLNGRTGDETCDYGECNGNPEFITDGSQQCYWALSMYEGDNLQGAPVAPTANGTVVLMFQTADPVNGAIRYTFLHAPVSKIGKIVAAGPCSGQVDYTDARYWVRIQDVTTGGIADALVFGNGPDIPNACSGGSCPAPSSRIVTATNLTELPNNTHGVQTDGTIDVLVTGVYDAGGTLRYVFEYSVLATGLFCPQGDGVAACAGALKPVYTTITNQTNNLFFSKNFFDVSTPVNAMDMDCDITRSLVDFEGAAVRTGYDPSYTPPVLGAAAFTCGAQILGFISPINQAEVTATDMTPTGAVAANQYQVLTGANKRQSTPDCFCDGDNNLYSEVDVFQVVRINPCDFAPTVTDGTTPGKIGTLTIGYALRLTWASSPSGCGNVATIGSSIYGAIFEVTLSGGGTTPLWVYQAFDLNGTSVGTGLTPEYRSGVETTVATTGCGYYNLSGTFVLKYADEVPVQLVCDMS